MSQNQAEFFFFFYQKEELPNTNTYLKKSKYLGTFGTFILISEMPLNSKNNIIKLGIMHFDIIECFTLTNV
jgi:hypothetical protein